MVVIKRYQNRKLYNTETKKYITLIGIADLIQQGIEIQVKDHLTGEDITAFTLTQIILDQEKKQSGLLSNSYLTQLIKIGSERISAFQQGSLHRIEDQIEKHLRRFQIPTNEDIQILSHQVDELTKKIDKILDDGIDIETENKDPLEN